MTIHAVRQALRHPASLLVASLVAVVDAALVRGARARRRRSRCGCAFTRTGQPRARRGAHRLASMPERWGASSVIVVGLAGVVAVFTALLAMATGFKNARSTGRADNAIILRGGSDAEINSVITRDQTTLIKRAPASARRRRQAAGVARDVAIVNLVARPTARRQHQLRGVGPSAFALRPQLKIVEGRKFNRPARAHRRPRRAPPVPGREVGQAAAACEPDWTVVGVFESGDAHEAELWADAEVAQSDVQPHGVPVGDGEAGRQGRPEDAAGSAGRRSAPDRRRDDQRDYYGKQSEDLTQQIGPRRGDRHDHGAGRDLRRAQHHVRRGGQARARDRHAARDRLRRHAGAGAVMIESLLLAFSAACSAR